MHIVLENCVLFFKLQQSMFLRIKLHVGLLELSPLASVGLLSYISLALGSCSNDLVELGEYIHVSASVSFVSRVQTELKMRWGTVA
jgi:hypothetical protein